MSDQKNTTGQQKKDAKSPSGSQKQSAPTDTKKVTTQGEPIVKP